MSHRTVAALAVSAIVMLAACSSSSSSPAASAAASAAGSGAASGGASVCGESAAAGAVTVNVVDFSFQPADITAKTGQVITFSNTGSAPHTATLDGGQCATPTIQPGKSDGLTFTVAGTYKFHCSIHSQMTGTIVVS
ncbi:MAG TPA: cupredoxin domain-containing protein [Candidatus Limnocylindrales bacterium]|jgi:plastocyanin|nr:cupredoxin domain-containing protein [Candidatus Limnocylindrales bacterium]